MIKFRVVTITNNLEEYPQYRDDTEEFPEMVFYVVEDEVDTFVVDTRNGDFWPAREFFNMVTISYFIIDSAEEPK